VKELPSDSLFVPGSLIRLETDPLDPIAYGLPEETAAVFVRSRAFEIVPLAGWDGEGERSGEVEREEVDVVARYAPSDLLLSGWELGADRHLGGRAAVVRVALGEGRIVLIGFRSQFRGQPRATFKLLFNSLLASTMKDLPGGTMSRPVDRSGTVLYSHGLNCMGSGSTIPGPGPDRAARQHTNGEHVGNFSYGESAHAALGYGEPGAR
jgi:hypothetical protein